LTGQFSYLLFSIGVIGTGLLAIPVLSGALSYVLAETFKWPSGLDKKFHKAKGFYLTMIVSMLIGLSLDYLKVSPITALLWAAILYGLTAPVLIFIILMICNNKKIMGKYSNGKIANSFGIIALIFNTLSSIALIYFLLK
jgi:Mn2+/Fe2+ NRAMP family transporter